MFLCLQMHRKQLLSGSFGPLQGPITTLTSLAAFKARFQQPAMHSVAQQPASSVSMEKQSCLTVPGEDAGQTGAQLNKPSPSAAAAAPDMQAASSALGSEIKAGHDISHLAPDSPRISGSMMEASEKGACEKEHADTHHCDVEMLWDDVANIRAAHATLQTFLLKSGLAKHLRIEALTVWSLFVSNPMILNPRPCLAAQSALHGAESENIGKPLICLVICAGSPRHQARGRSCKQSRHPTEDHGHAGCMQAEW